MYLSTETIGLITLIIASVWLVPYLVIAPLYVFVPFITFDPRLGRSRWKTWRELLRLFR